MMTALPILLVTLVISLVDPNYSVDVTPEKIAYVDSSASDHLIVYTEPPGGTLLRGRVRLKVHNLEDPNAKPNVVYDGVGKQISYSISNLESDTYYGITLDSFVQTPIQYVHTDNRLVRTNVRDDLSLIDVDVEVKNMSVKTTFTIDKKLQAMSTVIAASSMHCVDGNILRNAYFNGNSTATTEVKLPKNDVKQISSRWSGAKRFVTVSVGDKCGENCWRVWVSTHEYKYPSRKTCYTIGSGKMDLEVPAVEYIIVERQAIELPEDTEGVKRAFALRPLKGQSRSERSYDVTPNKLPELNASTWYLLKIRSYIEKPVELNFEDDIIFKTTSPSSGKSKTKWPRTRAESYRKLNRIDNGFTVYDSRYGIYQLIRQPTVHENRSMHTIRIQSLISEDADLSLLAMDNCTIVSSEQIWLTEPPPGVEILIGGQNHALCDEVCLLSAVRLRSEQKEIVPVGTECFDISGTTYRSPGSGSGTREFTLTYLFGSLALLPLLSACSW